MNVIVSGDRNWEDYDTLARVLDSLSNDTFIIEGGARGADTMALEYALWRGWDWQEYPALWGNYGRGAGNIRNQQMLDEGRPALLIAFHNDLERSKGTKHMVTIARRAGIPIVHGVSGLTWESALTTMIHLIEVSENQEL